MNTPTQLKGLSSLATKHVLLALAKEHQANTGISVNIETIGGVDAARRVAESATSGEQVDLIFLGSDAIDKLISAGHVQQGSRVDWVKSTVAVAVRSGTIAPDITSEASVKAAVIAAGSISYSTGPSGVYLAGLFERWGIADLVNAKLVQALPGVPVGSLVASGRVALGFQQMSELLGMDGIDVIGNLPEALACITTFSSGIPTSCNPAASQAARGLQAFLASSQTETAKKKYGMYWA
jgi:molybdate transport system substrate-binding protein